MKSPEKQKQIIVPSKKREAFHINPKGKTENLSEVYNNFNKEFVKPNDDGTAP